MILLSALLYALSLKMFINAGGLFPGGFSGLSVLATRLISKTFQIEIPFAVFYIALNIIPAFLVSNQIGKRFTIYSTLRQDDQTVRRRRL
jgi:uncharacterized membrane-anchored protein YitT (DUF2179 family)